MKTPSTTQLRTAIDVLNRLAERLKNDAEHSLNQLPETHLGDAYAARIRTRTDEQTLCIDAVVSQLESCRNSSNSMTEQPAPNHV